MFVSAAAYKWQGGTVRAGALVAAAGGSTNIDWLAEQWGDAARTLIPARQQSGSIWKCCSMRASGGSAPTQCHVVAIDACAPHDAVYRLTKRVRDCGQ